MDDRDIVSLYFERDETAITESERAYGTYCRTIAMSILDNPSDAEECVNDTWVAAWGSIPPKKPAILRTYLGKLTRNIAINRLRKGKRQKRNAEFILSLHELSECIPPLMRRMTAVSETFWTNFSPPQSPWTESCLLVGIGTTVRCRCWPKATA